MGTPKTKLFLVLIALLLIACDQEQRYAQNSPEVEIFKAVIKDYNDQDWEAMKTHYADTAKTFNNTINKPMSLDEIIAFHQQGAQDFSERGFVKEEDEYEMVVTDKGQTWVNYWGEWQATLAANGKEFRIPIHLTSQFKNGKIVRASGFWDNTPMVLATQEIEAKNNMPPDQKIMDQNLDILLDRFHNAKDITVLDNILATSYVRYMNGVKVATGAKELGESMSTTFMKAFPDMKITNSERIYNGNKVYIHWGFKGTNTGEFNGAPPTGKKVETTGISEVQFNGEGQLYLEKVFFNESDLLNQLGYTVNPPKL